MKKYLLILLFLLSEIGCNKDHPPTGSPNFSTNPPNSSTKPPHEDSKPPEDFVPEQVFGTTIQKTSQPFLTSDSATKTKSPDSVETILVHKSLDSASCGRIVGDSPSGKISKTGTFLITFNPIEKKYYVLLARKTKQGEIYRHGGFNLPEYFGSIIVTADRWGKWVTMGGGYDPSCAGKSSLCAARKEIEDESNVADQQILKKITFLDCQILPEKPETALFVAFLDWEDAQKLTTGKEEKQFVGLQTEKTKNIGKGTSYCQQYKCEAMHLFPEDSVTPSRRDLISSSHHEIGYIKWVKIDELLNHELLMNYVLNSINKFLLPVFMKKLNESFYSG